VIFIADSSSLCIQHMKCYVVFDHEVCHLELLSLLARVERGFVNQGATKVKGVVSEEARLLSLLCNAYCLVVFNLV